jgi:hypothetical protein
LDCFFVAECLAIFYVDYTNGNDTADCGFIYSPCKTFSYGVDISTSSSKVVILYNSNNNHTATDSFYAPSRAYDISGVTTNINNELIYPTIVLSSTLQYLVYSTYGSSQGNFSNLTFALNGTNCILYHSSTGSGGYVRFRFEFKFCIECI